MYSKLKNCNDPADFFFLFTSINLGWWLGSLGFSILLSWYGMAITRERYRRVIIVTLPRTMRMMKQCKTGRKYLKRIYDNTRWTWTWNRFVSSSPLYDNYYCIFLRCTKRSVHWKFKVSPVNIQGSMVMWKMVMMILLLHFIHLYWEYKHVAQQTVHLTFLFIAFFSKCLCSLISFWPSQSKVQTVNFKNIRQGGKKEIERKGSRMERKMNGK